MACLGSDQLARLHQILALKRLGLSLGQIGELLVGEDALDPILAFQERVLIKDSERIARALKLIGKARSKLAAGEALSIDDLATLTQETVMKTHPTDTELREVITPFLNKHFTPEDDAFVQEWSADPDSQNTANELWEEAKALMAAGNETSAAAMDFAKRAYAADMQFFNGSAATAMKVRLALNEAKSDPEASEKLQLLGFMERVVRNFVLPGFREELNDPITSDEDRAVTTWVASYPPDEMKAMGESTLAARALRKSFQDLRQNNIDPAAPEAQALAVRENEISLQYGLRNFTASMLEWNEPLAERWLWAVGRAVWRRDASEFGMCGEDLEAYYRAVHAASPWNTALRPIVDEAAELMGQMAQPCAAPAQALVGRLREICAEHALGDPLVYVRCAHASQFRRPSEDVGRKRAGWAFLAKAIAAAQARNCGA